MSKEDFKSRVPVDVPDGYHSKKTDDPDFYTVHCPDDSLLLDCYVTGSAAVVIVAALNNLVVIRDNVDSSPRWIAEMFLREIELIKPKILEV